MQSATSLTQVSQRPALICPLCPAVCRAANEEAAVGLGGPGGDDSDVRAGALAHVGAGARPRLRPRPRACSWARGQHGVMRAPWDTVDGQVRMLYTVVVFFKNAHGRHRSVGVATVYKLYHDVRNVHLFIR